MSAIPEQPIRDKLFISEREIITLIEEMKDISIKKDISLELVLKSCHILELRRQNSLILNHFNIHDVQMASLGKVLDRIDTSVQNISDHD
jgi:hypothetical protein